jgi:gamma-glutamylcyclotransferase
MGFHWFIYGSSLDVDAFAAWAREHGHRVPDFSQAIPVRLDGWRLAFDVRSRFWGGAVGSLLPAPGQSVEGIALPMPDDARGLVDHKEGAVSGLYAAFEVQVLPLAGGAPIPATAYRAADDRRLPVEEAPARNWLEVVLRGAERFGLSDGYRQALKARL